VTKRTPYFKSGPQQGRPADGYFAAGTKVGLSPHHKAIGQYVWAYTTAADGKPIDGKIPQGYVEKSAIQMDPQGHVLAEMDGPGCIVRIWSPNPGDAGHIRIYLDDAKDPVIDASMQELLAGQWQVETKGKKWTPFPDPIACERSRGWNLYFPIAYAKHCKVCTEKQDIYYHVDYRTYPKGTEVETFRLESMRKHENRLVEVRKVLREQDGERLSSLGGGHYSEQNIEGTIEARQQLGIVNQVGEPRVVLGLFLKVNVKKNVTAALRSLVLTGTFDGATKPQIWCPVGDFFASSPGFQPYSSLPFTVKHGTKDQATMEFASYWPMPIAKSGVFEVHNFGQEPVQVSLRTVAVSHPWTERSMHFHAKWRTETMKTRPFRDWTYCDLKGKGVFVGDMLSVTNPVKAWWGEGDEKIYVDGEKFPSWFGTGTEDYYAFGWSDPHPFQHAYHNQTRCDGPGNFGYTSVNRFHILDNIPFTKSFRFDMEVWHWTPDIEVNYAATSYWYARPDNPSPSDHFQEAPPTLPPPLPPAPPR